MSDAACGQYSLLFLNYHEKKLVESPILWYYIVVADFPRRGRIEEGFRRMEKDCEALLQAHLAEYRREPEVVAGAPGHFHLIGEHSWFFKDKTLSMAVDMPVHVSVSRRNDMNLQFYFVQTKDRRRSSATALKFRKEDRWSNAVKAVLHGFAADGFELPGFDMAVSSRMPPSKGFGITTAMKVAAAVAVRNVCRLDCSDMDLLHVLEQGNRQYLGTDSHMADNVAALFARQGALLVTDHTTMSWDTFDFPFADKTVLLTDAGVPRVDVWNRDTLMQAENVLLLGDIKESRQGVYGGWRYEDSPLLLEEFLSMFPEATRRRLSCIMAEHQNVLEAVGGLQRKNFGQFARAVNNSHRALRDLFDLSCPETDWILKRVAQLDENLEDIRSPTSCGRITGKGFGRCVYTVLDNADVDKYKRKLREYERFFGFHPRCYHVVPSAGARIVEG